MISTRLAGRITNWVSLHDGQWLNQSTPNLSASLVRMQVRCQPQCEQITVRGRNGIGINGLSVLPSADSTVVARHIASWLLVVQTKA